MSFKMPSRRRFLAGLGLGPALLPMLPMTRTYGGCLATPPKRAIFVVWTNGVLEWPSGAGAGFTLPATMSALEPHKADIIPIKGVRFQTLKDTPNPQRAESLGHGATPALITGRRYKELRHFVEIGGGPSMDAYIAAELGKRGVKTPRATLNLSVMHQGYMCSWRDSGQPAVPNNDPYKVFDELFAGGAGQAADPGLEKLRAARKSVLDLVRRDLSAFKMTVGKESAQRIEAHLTSLRELEQNMQTKTDTVTGCAAPMLGNKLDPKSTNNFHMIFKAHMDLAVAALAADVTRTVTIQLGNEANNHVIPTWLGLPVTGKGTGTGDENSHHTIGHYGDARKRKVDTWHHEQFAYLISKLKSEKEGNGTMLDNTVVLFANHMIHGGGHGIDNVPWLLAGRCGGYFKTGQNLNVGNVMHTAVLKEILVAMGVEPKGFFEPQYEADLPALRA